MTTTGKEKVRNKTGYRGVKWHQRYQRFEAYIRDDASPRKPKVYCGCAKTAEEAAKCYDRKAMEMYGPDAVLNFPR